MSRAAPDLLRDRIEQRPRLAFRSLAVVNIDGYPVPLNQVSLPVAQRRGANQEPAIFSVSPPQTHFILRGFPSGHVREPLFHHTWKVFGMNCARWLFNFLLQREARIVQPTLIDEINRAIRPNGPGHRGNCVDDKPHAIFRSLQSFDVARCSIPFDDVPLPVAQGHFAMEHPAICSIRPPHACFRLERFATGQARAPLAHESFDVFRMNHGRPGPPL